MTSKRQFSARLLALLGSPLLPGLPAWAAADTDLLANNPAARLWAANLGAGLAKIEAASGGRLGVAILDTATGARVTRHGDDRFPLCSTFKLLAAAAILKRVDLRKENLERKIIFEANALVPYSPVTATRTGGTGMRLAELCEAAITVSDNTAGNLLLASLGGPAGLTRYVRSLGDRKTRLDRTEPTLNQATPGDPRDTTTPAAMLGNLQTLLTGAALSPASRLQLLTWLEATRTSGQRLRARLPAGWRVGDKTGSGEHGATNDIGILWPEHRAPLLASIYLADTAAAPDERNATVAAVGALLAERLPA